MVMIVTRLVELVVIIEIKFTILVKVAEILIGIEGLRFRPLGFVPS